MRKVVLVVAGVMASLGLAAAPAVAAPVSADPPIHCVYYNSNCLG